MTGRLARLGLVVVLGLVFLGAAPDSLPEGYRLIFDSETTEDSYLLSDEKAWKIDDGAALELVAQSDYAPPHRSPLNIALLEPWLFGSFVMEVEVLQTGREYGHRDACFFFGFEDAERFYYAHLATAPDEHAHNVFLVDRADRVKTSPVEESGVAWGSDTWHTVRLVRSLETGTTAVYFDGASEPTVFSRDTTIEWGRVGVGSFDDTARFRRIRVWANEVRNASSSPW